MWCISACGIWWLRIGSSADSDTSGIQCLCVWSITLRAVEYRSGYWYTTSLRSTHSLHQPSVSCSVAHFLRSSPLSHWISIWKPEQAPYWQINIRKSRRKVWPGMPFTLSIQHTHTHLLITHSDAHPFHSVFSVVSPWLPPPLSTAFFCLTLITHSRFFFLHIQFKKENLLHTYKLSSSFIMWCFWHQKTFHSEKDH